jgi:hypothetical protein
MTNRSKQASKRRDYKVLQCFSTPTDLTKAHPCEDQGAIVLFAQYKKVLTKTR